jgi:hypothetical protein
MREVRTPTTYLAKLGETMKEIVLRIEDAAMEDFMALVRLCPSVEVVDVDEAAVPCESTMSARIREAIMQLRAERLLKRKFDYAWLKVAMDSTDDMPSFESAQRFLDYMRDELMLDDLPCESSISKMMDMARGQLFYWTFSDTSDAQETTRRNNIVKRFFCLMRGRK